MRALTSWSAGLVSVQVMAKAPSDSTVIWVSDWIPAVTVLTVTAPPCWTPAESKIRKMMSAVHS